MVTTFVPFDTTAPCGLARGSVALQYVMTHGHTISVPSDALECAVKVGVISIARRDTAESVLRCVNQALDVIYASLRTRACLERECGDALSTPPRMTTDDGDRRGGAKVPLEPYPRVNPPAAGMLRAF